ncbi:MAG: hypothetical protein ACI83N_000132 [Hydrogenophaga sp.]|jgi:hypothetical protein
MKAMPKRLSVHMGWIAACASLMAFAPLVHSKPEQKQLGYLTPAASGEGFHFAHHDWEVACDNTRTCRAAGYHADSDELKVSALFTRTAGPGTAIQGELKIGQYGDDPVVDKLPAQFDLSLRINGQPFGNIKLSGLHGELSDEQVTAMLRAMSGNSRIEFLYQQHRWRLSDSGAAAVMLKMDEFQGRVGTPGALIRKGARNEQSVRPPVGVRVLLAPPLPSPKAGDEQFIARHTPSLFAALRKTTDRDSCPRLFEKSTDSAMLRVTRLSESQMVVTAVCQLYAYNVGGMVWIIRTEPPFNPRVTPVEATELSGNQMLVRMKGRGLGDCWSLDDWTWNGKDFVHTLSSTTGMCKLMEPGGAWGLPVWITEVR